MKRIRIILACILFALAALGWIKNGRSTVSDLKEYSQHKEYGDSYSSEMLYQKAIIEYEMALDIKEDPEIRSRLIDTYEKSYQAGYSTFKDYTNALISACRIDRKNADYWKKLMQLYVDTNHYAKAYDVYKEAINAAGEDNFKEYEKLIVYDYKLAGRLYSEYYRSPDGKYSIKYNDLWGLMGSDGQWISDIDYDYISPVGETGFIAVIKDENSFLMDGKGIIQKYISPISDGMLAYGNGMIPVATQSGYQYLDADSGKLLSETYEKASSFQNKVAMAYIKGSWRQISTDLSIVGDLSFDDVKLYANGEYIYDSIMVASVGGTYGLYKKNGKAIVSVDCKDMDNYYGDYLAYQDSNGLWGYINKKGKVVIEPKFKEARSFSHGLAAVFDGKKWGYIDHDADLVIPCQFLNADYFTDNGIVLVSSDGKTYQILKLRF